LNHPDAIGGGAAFGINDFGQVVGYYTDASGSTHAYQYAADSFISIDHPSSGGYTIAYGINNLGAIVGIYGSGTQHGFLLSGSTFTPLDVPGAVSIQTPLASMTPETSWVGMSIPRARHTDSYTLSAPSEH
jgi:probable HAF family extracellular repeat protein